ncbi:hypothetical protein L6V77_11510 [Myxococcota bacterium]|nr:hypothetical protein [Myxococcota bacterium]
MKKLPSPEELASLLSETTPLEAATVGGEAIRRTRLEVLWVESCIASAGSDGYAPQGNGRSHFVVQLDGRPGTGCTVTRAMVIFLKNVPRLVAQYDAARTTIFVTAPLECYADYLGTLTAPRSVTLQFIYAHYDNGYVEAHLAAVLKMTP